MSANANQPRQPRGVPTGGQWRATNRPEGSSLGPATVWADDKGQFVLSSGKLGNPGCDDCGEADAVVRHNGRYLCADAAEEAGIRKSNSSAGPTEDLCCQECSNPCGIDDDGIAYHLNEDGATDHDLDADHVAIPDLDGPLS